jgi:hypothetical protein
MLDCQAMHVWIYAFVLAHSLSLYLKILYAQHGINVK